MELRHLRHVAAVIELGNVSKAAVMLAISQPALTRSIQLLEEMLGAPLIERLPRGVVPTPAGEALYRHAKLILSETKRARESVTAIKIGVRGNLRIGIASMFAERIIDRAIVDFAAKHERVGIVVTEGYFEDLLPWLQEGKLDMVFCNLPGIAVPDGLLVEPVLDVRAVMVSNTAHPLARKATVTRAELSEARWVTVNQHHMKEYLDHFFAVQGLHLQRPLIQTNSLPLIRSLLALDTFVSMLPEVLIEADLKARKLKRLKIPGGEIRRQAGIIRRAKSAASPADEASLKNFILILGNICAEEGKP